MLLSDQLCQSVPLNLQLKVININMKTMKYVDSPIQAAYSHCLLPLYHNVNNKTNITHMVMFKHAHLSGKVMLNI